jgi:hypothetical protein
MQRRITHPKIHPKRSIQSVISLTLLVSTPTQWRGNYVAIRQLVEDFGRYLYLPRLQTTGVLLNAVRAGLALLTWEHDAFAYAESYDESAARYRGLHSGSHIDITCLFF